MNKHTTRNTQQALRFTYRSVFPIMSGILALLVYLTIAWFILPPGAFWTSDEGAKLLQLENLRWENGRLAHDIAYTGRELDPELQFAHLDPRGGPIRVRDAKLYFQRLPIFPLLVLPLFRRFGYYGLYLLPAVSGAVIGVLALQLLKRSDRRFGMWVLIAFGSPVFIYATIFWEHTLATSLGLVGAWLAFRIGPTTRTKPLGKIFGWTAIGVLLGFGAYIRFEMLIFALALLFAYWFVVRNDRWGPVWAGLVLLLVMLPYRPLHGLVLGGQKMPENATYLFRPARYLTSAGWKAVPDLLIGPVADASIDTGWLGDLWAIAAVIVIAHSFGATSSPAMRTIRLVGLAVTAIVGAIFLFDKTFYHSGHGLLFTTPWALLGLSRARKVWQSGGWRARVVVLSALLGLIGHTVGIIGLRGASPHGGLEWGARFAMPYYPLLALIAAWDLGEKRRDVKTLVVVGTLMFLGLGFQVRGIGTIRHDKRVNDALNRMVIEMPEQHIISDQVWVPFVTAPVYAEKGIFVADTPEEFGNWIKLAAAHHVWHFSLVTANAVLLDETSQILDDYELGVIEVRRIKHLFVYRVIIEPE